jgi:hypothetical protein
LVKVADLVPTQTQNFELHVGEAFDALLHVTVHRHPDTVNAFHSWKTQRKVGDVVG